MLAGLKIHENSQCGMVLFLLTKWGMHSVRKLRKTNAWRLITYRKANNEKEIIKLHLPIWGSFFNYVDQILPTIDHLPTPFWHWWRNSFIVIWENLHIVDNSIITTYLPPLVTYFKNAPLLVCSLQMSIVIFSIINMFWQDFFLLAWKT